MNRAVRLAAVLAALVPCFALGQAGGQESAAETWREILRFGIETEVLATIKQIADSGEQGLNAELLQFVRPESSPALLQAVLELFGGRGINDAEPAVLRMLEDGLQSDSRRLAPMIRYLAAIRSQASQRRLLELLDSSDEQVAMAAIGALGALGGADSGGRLLELLNDPRYPEGRKSQLISALGKLKFIPAVDVLIKIAENPDESKTRRLQAVSALGEIGDQRAVPVLRGLLGDPDALLRAYAASAMTGFDMSEVQAVLQEALRDPNAKVRLAAARALADPQASQAVDILIYKARKDPERQVRLQAVESLARIGGAKAFGFLRELYQDSGADVPRREAALSALCERNLPESLPVILSVIDREWPRKDLTVLSFTARRLAAAEAPGLESVFERFLSHPNEMIRLYGLKGARINRIHGLKRRIESMAAEDPHPAVRREAAIAAGEL